MRDYQDMVFTSALRLVGNEADAEDIAQDVFLKAYMHFDQLRHSFTVGGWLKTVTRNLSLNHLTRYRARWRFFSECDDHGESGEHHDFAANLPAPDLPTQAVDTADRRNLLESAIQARAAVIVTACPLCQVNLECYQKQVNKEFGTDYKMPVMYFTQLMGLALGIPPKRLGIGSELVAVMPAIREAQEAAPALAAK